MKKYPVVTLRPKAAGVLETTTEEVRDKLAFDVLIRRESEKGWTPVATCKAGDFFPKRTYEEVDRTWIEEGEDEDA